MNKSAKHKFDNKLSDKVTSLINSILVEKMISLWRIHPFKVFCDDIIKEVDSEQI